MFKKFRLKRLITKAAKENGIPLEILASVIWHESVGGIANIMRYEDGFYHRYLENKDMQYHVPNFPPTKATERRLRAFSYGYCQIMGETARRFGFKNQMLTDLLKPKINIPLGAKILASYIRQHGGNIIKGLLGYNGGADPTYPDTILTIAKTKNYEALWQ